MPGDQVGPVCKKVRGSCVIGAMVDEMDLREAFWCSTCLMRVMAAKLAAPFYSFLDWKVGEVLIAESDNLLLCDEEGQLVLAMITKLAY